MEAIQGGSPALRLFARNDLRPIPLTRFVHDFDFSTHPSNPERLAHGQPLAPLSRDALRQESANYVLQKSLRILTMTPSRTYSFGFG